MDPARKQKVFGSRRRTEVLVLVALLGETYPSELARLLDARLYSIQTIVAALAWEGIIATRMFANSRRVSLDPRYFAYRDLKSLLLRLAEAEPDLRAAAARRRSRPRTPNRAL